MLHKAINKGGIAEDTDWMGIQTQILRAKYGWNTPNWPNKEPHHHENFNLAPPVVKNNF